MVEAWSSMTQMMQVLMALIGGGKPMSGDFGGLVFCMALISCMLSGITY